MKITKVRVDSYTPSPKGICASMSVYFDSELVVHRVHVINGKKGLFVAFPNTGEYVMDGDNSRRKFVDVVHPCSETLRKEVNKAIIDAYENYTPEDTELDDNNEA